MIMSAPFSIPHSALRTPHLGQRMLPLEISARSALITLEAVRIARGCDAESVLNCVGDATHPKFLRWVFDLSVNPNRIRELRFWKEEVWQSGKRESGKAETDAWAEPAAVINQILGARKTFPRGEIEIAWCVNATTIGRLVRAGELTEVKRQLTRASLAAFLERRLQ